MKCEYKNQDKYENKPVNRKVFMASLCLLIASVIALVAVTVSWVFNQRKLATIAWVKTPIILEIGSGDHKAISYLDMGNIDVDAGNSRDYVFCVYGTPVDNYALQLSYTTNIAFTYKVYRAKMTGNPADVPSYYEGGVDYFAISSDTPVITGLPLTKLTNPEMYQSHHMSYGDEYGENAVNPEMVQKNNEPLYWLAKENGLNLLRPQNILNNTEQQTFLDYFILHVEWSDDVVNDKETDIVYLTASL